ncbi:MAG: hypothetical protein A3H32_02105 [Betaproteobacteria bacterium RIFCSPLOWO2_02_FULL_63_19]|nr:MAG: hypothetical protein A3H32_02105 [Betaproteobacteria bacterium RIFCSPLOWO2_02_FULL_63_19]
MPSSDSTRPADSAATGPRAQNSRCARCGAGFHCGAGAGESSCWCAATPNVMPVPRDDAGCYCPSCLAQLAAQHARPR